MAVQRQWGCRGWGRGVRGADARRNADKTGGWTPLHCPPPGPVTCGGQVGLAQMSVKASATAVRCTAVGGVGARDTTTTASCQPTNGLFSCRVLSIRSRFCKPTGRRNPRVARSRNTPTPKLHCECFEAKGVSQWQICSQSAEWQREGHAGQCPLNAPEAGWEAAGPWTAASREACRRCCCALTCPRRPEA